MIDNQEIIKKTKLFGLNTYEAKIWVTLLGRGVSTAGEISDMADVPRSRSYDVLESLEKKGFVIMKPGKPIKYFAVEPKEVLENVKKNIQKNTEKHLLEIKSANFNNLINEFQQLHEKNTNQSESVVAVLKGKKNIYKHLTFLLNNTKDISLSAETTSDEYAQALNATRDKQKKLIKSATNGFRLCVAGEDNAIIFPFSESDTHPDYDLGIWVRDKQTTKFFKQLLSSTY